MTVGSRVLHSEEPKFVVLTGDDEGRGCRGHDTV
jgi:hypothetical protein